MATQTARLYGELERRLRALIDSRAGRVCPGCTRTCCKGVYCRATVNNPWYAFVRQTCGTFSLPADALSRTDPFGLGPEGCEIRAGRYVYCYSYNCPPLLGSLPAGPERRAFQEVSDLLRSVNRLPGGRLLHELQCADDLGPEDLGAIDRRCRRALERLAFLEAGPWTDATPPDPAPQGERR